MTMKKRMLAALCLLLCAVLLTACSSGTDTNGTRFDVLASTTVPTQNVLNNPTVAPTTAPTTYIDPLAEENVPDVSTISEPAVVTDVPRVDSVYAGATPVVIDPIDKPTATPVPALSFTYQVYDATKLHLSFEAPVGWIVNDSADDIYILTNPSTNVDYAASITVYTTSVAAEYTQEELRSEVKSMQNTLASAFASFSGTNTASRTLLGQDGIYADYTAAMADGTRVSGRVQAVSIGRMLYVVHFSWPRAYNETYKDTVYAQFRKTAQVTQ